MPIKILKIKIIFLAILFCGIFGVAGKIFAAEHYIRAGATGANDGNNWTDAWVELPESLVRGDTYYIADGDYAAYSVSPVSGTEFINIKKATTSVHGTDQGWLVAYGDGQAIFDKWFNINTSYVVLDGVSRSSDWRSDYGIKIKTQYADRMSKSMRIGQGTYVTDVTVRFVDIEGSGDDLADGSNDLVYIVPSGGTSSNIVFQYCALHDAGRTNFVFRNTDSGVIEYCYIARNESTADQHSEAISAATSSDYWVVRNNIWDTIEGTGVIVVGEGGNWKVYGNIFYNYTSASNGIFVGWTAEYMTGGEFYNNTVVDCNYARIGFVNDTGIIAKNNLFVNNTLVDFGGQNTHDYNAFSGSNVFEEIHGQVGLSTDIFADYAGRDFHLTQTTNLGDSSIGSEYDRDIDGELRGGDDSWDRGAYEFFSSDTTPPNIPGGLSVE